MSEKGTYILIPVIQGVVLLVGLYFGMSWGYFALKTLVHNSISRTKVMILLSIFALFMVNVLLKL